MKSNDSALHADPLLPLVGYFLRVGTWGSADRETLSFDVAEVERIIGRKGRVSGGVWHLSVPRGEKFTEEGMEAPPSMGAGSSRVISRAQKVTLLQGGTVKTVSEKLN